MNPGGRFSPVKDLSELPGQGILRERYLGEQWRLLSERVNRCLMWFAFS